MAAAIGELKSCAATSGVIGIEMLGRAAVGSGLIRIEGEAKAQARAIEQLRRSAAFGNVVLRRGSTELKALVDVWGPLGERQPLLASLKRAFDPQGILNRGPWSAYERVRRRRSTRDHPPIAPLIDKCVHCGFCLPSCPTYVLWGEEMDSPRGRIYLMKAGLEGRTAMAPSFVQHFDACLGCMACVTACPSGVQYAPLIEATRGQIERRFERSWSDRLFRCADLRAVPVSRTAADRAAAARVSGRIVRLRRDRRPRRARGRERANREAYAERKRRAPSGAPRPT